jgi:hypothetical protein
MRPALEDERDLAPWDDDPNGADAHYIRELRPAAVIAMRNHPSKPRVTCRLGAAGTGVVQEVTRTRNSLFWRFPDQTGLDGMYDGGHSADQPPEPLDCPGFAGDVDVGV